MQTYQLVLQIGAELEPDALGWPTLGITPGVAITLFRLCLVPVGHQPQALPAALGYHNVGHTLNPKRPTPRHTRIHNPKLELIDPSLHHMLWDGQPVALPRASGWMVNAMFDPTRPLKSIASILYKLKTARRMTHYCNVGQLGCPYLQSRVQNIKFNTNQTHKLQRMVYPNLAPT